MGVQILSNAVCNGAFAAAAAAASAAADVVTLTNGKEQQITSVMV